MPRPRSGRFILQAVTVVGLVGATLAAFAYAHAQEDSANHRQHREAAQRVSLRIDQQLKSGLAAQEGVYGLAQGQPTFDGKQFVRFGQGLIRKFNFSYVAWAPAVDRGERRAFEKRHGVEIAGAHAMDGDIAVPVLWSATQPRVRDAPPGLNLLASSGIRQALVESAENQDPSIASRARVDRKDGAVLLQPMFARDERGERIAGWVVAGIRADALVGSVRGALPGGAVVHVAQGDATLAGPPGPIDSEDAATLSVGRSKWEISVTGIGRGFSPFLPWIVLALGFVLAASIAFLFRQAARLDRARRAEVARLAQAALVDSLTDARNHRAFQEDLERELRRRGRSGGPISVALLDVNGLKQVNDTLGHHQGDERLKLVAETLRATARRSDVVYRLGGDEFALMLPDTDSWEAFQLVQRLNDKLARPGRASVSVAVGIAQATDLETRDSLVRKAGLALAEAKRARRGCLLYSEELEPDVRDSSTEDDAHNTVLSTALAVAVDAKDSYTRSHCETVSQLCVMIAGELRFAPRHIGRIRLAGLLHDVGKIGVDDAILRKPAKLTDEEYETMKKHSSLGRDIVSAAGLEEHAGWILHHHERPDGRGYPDGLQGEEIPIESRIILVADAFEAITADRPYRRHASVADALVELDRHAGTQFDPECVAALRRAIGNGSALPDEAASPASLAAVS